MIMIKINNQTRVIIINNCLISLEGCLPKGIECSTTDDCGRTSGRVHLMTVPSSTISRNLCARGPLATTSSIKNTADAKGDKCSE